MQRLFDRVAENLRKAGLNSGSGRLLLAVSGGLDSVCLARLLSELGYDFLIAHANFQLRGAASDEDQEFVRRFAAELGVEFYTRRFETQSEVQQSKDSLQMVARNQRYDWMNELLVQHDLVAIVTAHHQDDQAETVLLNLVRGTGMAGMAGMALRNGNRIRPLLDISKEELQQLALAKGWAWREDHSNQNTNYRRNKIRQEVMPQLTEINPSVNETIARSAERNREYLTLLQQLVAEKWEGLIPDGEGYHLSIQDWKELPTAAVVLYEWLRPFGFSWVQAQTAASMSAAQPGGKIEAANWVLHKDRTKWHLRRNPSGEVLAPVNFSPEQTELEAPIKLRMRTVSESGYEMVADSTVAALDFDRLSFPLVLRSWRDGDRFQPLGMNGRKKVSDYLTDEQVPRADKSKVLVLESDGEIAWLVGYRIAHPFRITSETKRIWEGRVLD